MAQKKKVKVVQVALAEKRIAIVDRRGRVFERTTDMEIGAWGQIDLPDEPAAEGKRRARKR